MNKQHPADIVENADIPAAILTPSENQENPVPADTQEPAADGVDQSLVEESAQHLTGLFRKQIHGLLLEAGKYIIEKFFGGDYQLAMQKKPAQMPSIKALIERLNSGSGSNQAPSKSWIYNAINIAIDNQIFSASQIFDKYSALTPSNKVLLTTIKNAEIKNELVEKCADEGWTHLQLRQKINQKKKSLRKKCSKPNVGFRDFTEGGHNVNIYRGCENGCYYCYARVRAAERFKTVKYDQWTTMELNQSHDDTRKKYPGRVGFPSTHDITPTSIDRYLEELGKLLRADNEVLIVSKPNEECIRRVCEACQFFKDKIIFRFTIGASNDDILKFWEPNAPDFASRLNSLKMAHEMGFTTSISIEPMLDPDNLESLLEQLLPYVTETVWLGKMNHFGMFKERLAKEQREAGEKLLNALTPEKLSAIDHRLAEKFPVQYSMLRWKSDARKDIDSFREKQKVEPAETPENENSGAAQNQVETAVSA